MKHYTKQDIFRMVEEDDVEFIRLQFTDMFGNFKNVAITTSQLEKALNNECMFDGSSIAGFAKVEASDMYLYPDLDTYVTFPWRPQQGKVARLICDIYTVDGKPLESDPRYIFKKVIREAEEMGYQFDVGPELEFFLFQQDANGQPTTDTHEKAEYFDMGPLDFGENARRDMVLTLEEMGISIEASHHEVAPAQHEIDMKYGDSLTSADNIMTFKMVVRTIAQRHGLHATFMPKPKAGVDGSGMHINMSLKKEGVNIFHDATNTLGISQEAYYFIGGIMQHMESITAITNPLINSYKRLVPNHAAPVYIAWSTSNRSSLIRIPAERGESTRLELRCPDPSANPYLALAVCLAAGLDGIKKQCIPKKCIDKNIFAMSQEEREEDGVRNLPDNLHDAIDSLNKSEFIKAVLGEEFTRIYVQEKRAEWDIYRKQISQWELDQYLYRI